MPKNRFVPPSNVPSCADLIVSKTASSSGFSALVTTQSPANDWSASTPIAMTPS